MVEAFSCANSVGQFGRTMTVNSQDKTTRNQTPSRYLRIFRMQRFRVSLRKLQYPRQLILWVFYFLSVVILLLSVLLVRIQSLCNCQLYLSLWKNQGGLCLAEFRASWLFLGRVDQFFLSLVWVSLYVATVGHEYFQSYSFMFFIAF